MPSIIEGYNYDIFISYRQKDNKGGRQGAFSYGATQSREAGWVSEFVEALKTELESTFKEEISVYFDINPHDGLLETHDVDASLKDKLKCLVFIPIISRTYCDPKSFAWEHEFKAFVEHASKDQFGLKVKLPNGNVANRILPIRIHDLDNADIKECESVLGGVLRGVEFIYKEPGVNRSLSPKDYEEKNLNNTNYRNQINKVALAIKEIIQGFSLEPAKVVIEKDLLKESVKEVREDVQKVEGEKSTKAIKVRFITAITVVALLIVAGIIAYPKIFKRDTLERLRASGERISVAVLPFQNLTGDTTRNIWQEIIQDNLISFLSNSEDLMIRQAESVITLLQNTYVTNYASITPSIASSISQKLNANVFVHGSINQIGDVIRLIVKLFHTETEEVFKSFLVEGTADNLLHMTDSISRLVKNFLVLSKYEKDVNPDYQQFASTNSPEAYKYFIYGKDAYENGDIPTEIAMMLQAIKIDSNFYWAKVMLAYAYWGQGMYEDAKKLCLSNYKNRDIMPMQMKIWTNILFSELFETPKEAIDNIRQLQEIDDQLPLIYYNKGRYYNSLQQYDNAITEFEKALTIYDKWGSKPMFIYNYTLLGIAYHKTGQYKKEKNLYKKALQYFPVDPNIIGMQAILSLTERDTVTANEYIKKWTSYRKDQSWSEARIARNMAIIYSEANFLDKAEEFYRKSLSLESESPLRLNVLAYFLIDKNRNISEGLELVDKALKINPDNYDYLDTKGWGLYKQGKFKEALEFIQKADSFKPTYSHELYLHLEAAKNAVARQKNN